MTCARPAHTEKPSTVDVLMQNTPVQLQMGVAWSHPRMFVAAAKSAQLSIASRCFNRPKRASDSSSNSSAGQGWAGQVSFRRGGRGKTTGDGRQSRPPQPAMRRRRSPVCWSSWHSVGISRRRSSSGRSTADLGTPILGCPAHQAYTA